MGGERPSGKDFDVETLMLMTETTYRDRFMELMLHKDRHLTEITRMLVTARVRLLEAQSGTPLHRERANTLRYLYVAYSQGADIDKEKLDDLARIEDMDPLHAPDPTDEAFIDIALHFHTTEEQ